MVQANVAATNTVIDSLEAENLNLKAELEKVKRELMSEKNSNEEMNLKKSESEFFEFP